MSKGRDGIIEEINRGSEHYVDDEKALDHFVIGLKSISVSFLLKTKDPSVNPELYGLMAKMFELFAKKSCQILGIDPGGDLEVEIDEFSRELAPSKEAVSETAAGFKIFDENRSSCGLLAKLVSNFYTEITLNGLLGDGEEDKSLAEFLEKNFKEYGPAGEEFIELKSEGVMSQIVTEAILELESLVGAGVAPTSSKVLPPPAPRNPSAEGGSSAAASHFKRGK